MVSRQWYEAQGSAEPPGGKGFIVTDDPVAGMQQLSTIYRNKFSIPVVAIGGSNGKTTTKEMVASVLGTAFKVQMSQGNRNNHLGVPLTLLQLRHDTDIAVVEMGINHPGEMTLLAAIARPTHALLTNIGHEHLEFLLDLDGVAAAETQLFDYLSKSGGTAFVNTDDPWLTLAGEGLAGKVTYGIQKKPDHACWAREILLNREGRLSFLLCSAAGTEAVTLNFTGKHNVINALQQQQSDTILASHFVRSEMGLNVLLLHRGGNGLRYWTPAVSESLMIPTMLIRTRCAWQLMPFAIFLAPGKELLFLGICLNLD